MLCHKRGHHQREAPARQLEGSPHLLQPEKRPCSSEDPAQPKANKHINKKLHMHTYIFKEDSGILLLKKVTLHLVCSCGVLLSAPPPAPALAHTGPHWVISHLYSCLGKPCTSHIAFPVSSHPPKKISAITHPTLSLMRPAFNNCSVHRIQDFPFHFPGPPAISLRQTLSFLTPLFNSLHFSHTNTLWNFFIPKWHYLINQH